MPSSQLIFCQNCGNGFQTMFEDRGQCSTSCLRELERKRAAVTNSPTSFYISLVELDYSPQLDPYIKDIYDDPSLSVDRCLIRCRCNKCRAQFKVCAEAGYPLPFITLNSKDGQLLYMKFGLEAVISALKILKTTSVYAPTRRAKRVPAEKNPVS